MQGWFLAELSLKFLFEKQEGGESVTKAIRTKKKKKNNVVILIGAENNEELEAIKRSSCFRQEEQHENGNSDFILRLWREHHLKLSRTLPTLAWRFERNMNENTMNLSKIIELGLVNDRTEIWCRDRDMYVLAHGNWYQDNVLEYGHREVESFTWQDDDKLFIDLK